MEGGFDRIRGVDDLGGAERPHARRPGRTEREQPGSGLGRVGVGRPREIGTPPGGPRRVDQLSPQELAAEIAALTGQLRARQLLPQEAQRLVELRGQDVLSQLPPDADDIARDLVGQIIVSDVRYAQLSRADRRREAAEEATNNGSLRRSLRDGFELRYQIDPASGRVQVASLRPEARPAQPPPGPAAQPAAPELRERGEGGTTFQDVVDRLYAQGEFEINRFLSRPPEWFRRLPDAWKSYLEWTLRINAVADLKNTVKDTAETSKKMPGMDRGYLRFAWRHVPGFRMVMATMLDGGHGLFAIDRATGMMTLTDRGKYQLNGEHWEGYRQQLIDTLARYLDGHRELLQDDMPSLLAEQLTDYFTEHEGLRRDNARNLTEFFNTNRGFLQEGVTSQTAAEQLRRHAGDNPQQLGDFFRRNQQMFRQDVFPNPAREDTETAAKAAVAMAWNILYVGHTVESANDKRDRNLLGVIDEIRAWMQPLDKALSKWAADEPEPWGGKLGTYLQLCCQYAERGIADRLRGGTYLDKVRRGMEGYRLMPRRLFGAFLDLTTFRDRDGTLAQALVNGGKREVTTGLYDFQDPREINFSQLGEANPDLWIPYATLLGKVNEISNALTSPEPKALPEENIIRALTGLRKNPSLRAIYTDEDLTFACVLAILGGPMQGVPQTLADQPGSDVDYNNLVESVLSDPRLYEGMAGNRKEIKERFRQRLIAEDPTKVALLQIGPTRRDNVKRQSRLGQ